MGLRPIRGLYGRPTQAPFSHSLFYLQKPGNHYTPLPNTLPGEISTNIRVIILSTKTWQPLYKSVELRYCYL